MKIIADVDYVTGHLRYGHWELELNDEDYRGYKNLSEEDRIAWIEEDGNFIIDDYRIDDIGTITEIKEENN
jgi:hypothetical protein